MPLRVYARLSRLLTVTGPDVGRLWHRYDLVRSIPKSILFNFRYLPWREAITLPVLVSHRVLLKQLRGTVRLAGSRRTGTVRIGFGDVGIYDRRRSRTIWSLGRSGSVVFSGRAFVGHGCRLNIEGSLTVGNDVTLSAEVRIVCHERIDLGDDVLIGWEAVVIDTDFHGVRWSDGRHNSDAAVSVGDHVWICAGAWVHPGVALAPGCVVAGGARVTRSFSEPGAMLAGVPAQAVGSGIVWTRERAPRQGG